MEYKASSSPHNTYAYLLSKAWMSMKSFLFFLFFGVPTVKCRHGFKGKLFKGGSQGEASKVCVQFTK